MTDVSAAEITEARRDYEVELLPDTATQKRPTNASDGGGGRIPSWTVVGTLACRLEPYGGATSARGAGGESDNHPGERLESRISHMVSLPAGADVRLTDRLEINGTTYEVNILRERAAWELSRRVEVKEIF